MSIGTAEVKTAAYNSTLEVEYEISIGSKKFPEYNIQFGLRRKHIHN